jgi:hypothetical protein
MGNHSGSALDTEVPLHEDAEADLVRSRDHQAEGTPQAAYVCTPKTGGVIPQDAELTKRPK